MFAASAASAITEQKEQPNGLDEIREIATTTAMKITLGSTGRMIEIEFDRSAAATAMKFRALVKNLENIPNAKFVAYLGDDTGRKIPTVLLTKEHYEFLHGILPEIFTLESVAKSSKAASSEGPKKRWS
jgi:hypothetical protein